MGMPSASWPRLDKWAVASPACRKERDLRKPSSAQEDIGFSALGKTERKAGKEHSGLLRQRSKQYDSSLFYTHQSVDERLLCRRLELTDESVEVNLVVAYAPTKAGLNTQVKK